MNAFILVALCIFFSALASIFLKLGADTLTNGFEFKSLISNPMIWCGGLFYAMAFFSYIYTIRIIPLSLVQPSVTAGVSVITVTVAVVFFREYMSATNWLGLILVCTGIFLLFMNRS
jgi:multidrug transporter EmrE-like cation transporter